MTFDQFIKKHLGKAMDYDGVSGVQCVDLAKYYLDEVFGIKAGAWGDARAYYENYSAHSELTILKESLIRHHSFLKRETLLFGVRM